MFLRVNRKNTTLSLRGGLRVLAAQGLLAPLLAHALFLGCTVGSYKNGVNCGIRPPRFLIRLLISIERKNKL